MAGKVRNTQHTPKLAAERATRAPVNKNLNGLSFIPTELQRTLVQQIVGFGFSQEDICLIIKNPDTGRPIDLKTLHKHFRQELDDGLAVVNSGAARSLYQQVRGTPAQYDAKGNKIVEEVPPNPQAQMFWARARLGWRDKDPPISAMDLDNLTEAQLETLIARIETAIALRRAQAAKED